MRLIIFAHSPELSYGLAPRVNLLPAPERQRRELTELTRRWAWIAGVVVAAIALLSLAIYALQRSSQSGLDREQARTATLVRELATYRDVSAATRDLGTYQSFRTQAMSTDLVWSSLLGTLQAAVPKDATVTGFDILTGPQASPAAAAAGADQATELSAAAPAGTAATALLTVAAGRAPDQQSLVTALQRVPGVLGAELTGLSSDRYPLYSATTVVYLDARIYSQRFAVKAR